MGWTPDTASVARRLVLAAAALAAFAVPAGASPCISAALRAEETWGLPPRLLLAIGIVESGLDPNALNAEGTPMRPATAAEAVAVVRTLRADGVRSIDTGCFQVNLKWHPQAFATLEEAFVPDRNAHYAARHLADLYGEAGSWTEAVGLYHSADRDRQDLYRAKVIAAVRALRDGRDPDRVTPMLAAGSGLQTSGAAALAEAADELRRARVEPGSPGDAFGPPRLPPRGWALTVAAAPPSPDLHTPATPEKRTPDPDKDSR